MCNIYLYLSKCVRLTTDIWLTSQGHETLKWGSDNLLDVNNDKSEYILALKKYIKVI